MRDRRILEHEYLAQKSWSFIYWRKMVDEYSKRGMITRKGQRRSTENGLKGKLIHDFRRTAARNYVRAGVPQRVAQELLGHQTASIFSRYNIVSDQDLREAPKKVMEYMNNQAVDKPIENPPEGFRLWEPALKKILDETERVKQEWREQQTEEHGAVVQIGRQGEDLGKRERPRNDHLTAHLKFFWRAHNGGESMYPPVGRASHMKCEFRATLSKSIWTT